VSLRSWNQKKWCNGYESPSLDHPHPSSLTSSLQSSCLERYLDRLEHIGHCVHANQNAVRNPRPGCQPVASHHKQRNWLQLHEEVMGGVILCRLETWIAEWEDTSTDGEPDWTGPDWTGLDWTQQLPGGLFSLFLVFFFFCSSWFTAYAARRTVQVRCPMCFPRRESSLFVCVESRSDLSDLSDLNLEGRRRVG